MEGDTIIKNSKTSGSMSPKDMDIFIEKALDDDKAQDIVSIKIHDSSAITDYMIVATGTSNRHVHSLAENLKQKLTDAGVKNIRVEGLSQSDWVVLDIGDIIVHIFRPEVRSFYNIEKMWSIQGPFDSTPQNHGNHIQA